MIKLLALLLAIDFGLLAQTNMTQENDFRSIAVNNSTWSAIPCPLHRAKFVQVMIKPSGTAQIFTLRDPTTLRSVEIPSGGSYEAYLSNPGCQGGQTLWELQTATGATTAQVIGQKEGR